MATKQWWLAKVGIAKKPNSEGGKFVTAPENLLDFINTNQLKPTEFHFVVSREDDHNGITEFQLYYFAEQRFLVKGCNPER